MSEFDPLDERALAQLRASWEHPPGIEDRLLEAIHARVAADGGPDPEGGESGPEGAGGPSGRRVYMAKIAGATVAATAAGLLLLAGLGQVVSDRSASPSAPRVRPSLAVPSAEVGAPVLVSDPAVRGAVEAELAPDPEAELAPESGAELAALEREEPRVRAKARAAQTRAPKAAGGPTLEAELELLRVAKAGTDIEALAALEAHARRFPTGTLARERDGLRIITLCRVGRDTEAQRHLDHFAAAAPGSMQFPRLRSACPQLEFPPTDPPHGGDGTP